jgi:catechol 2,3-dioxygenase-like lactoylglutathione lyase family enzyme
MLFVTDMARAVAFYARLGFEVAFLRGRPPFYGQVARDGARLNLRHADTPAFTEAFRAVTEDALSASITVTDAEALFAEYRAADVPLHQRLRDEPWGARTFIVRDPDGNLLLFAGSDR